MAQFIPASAAEPSAFVELTISCRNLADCDVFSKSDPMCVVYVKTPDMDYWQEISRTETIQNTLNPDFTKKVHIVYRFEVHQSLKFEVYDIDSSNPNLADQDFLGVCETTLGQVVSNVKLVLPLTSKFNCGELIVVAEELSHCKDEVTLQFRGRQLDRKDWFGSSDPFLEFRKSCEDGEYRVIHRTEVIKWTLNPNWLPFTVPLYTLCNNDMDREVKTICYDWNRSGNHSLIGEFYFTMNQLKKGPGSETVFQCINPNKQHKKSYTNSGIISLARCEIKKVYSFLDYIMAGTQLNCTVAIDFTASNGDPSLANSLHYINEWHLNQYELALTAVVEIIQDYHSTKQFPVLGFGARLPPDGRISHEFYVNQHPSNPYCYGVSGVLEAYRKCIRSVQLYGPTNFSPVINHVARFAKTYTDGSQYFILLIITDGVITDMAQTKQAVVSASVLPMSIIIVGVGSADFSAMKELDADTVPLVSNGKKAARDIVQFVPFHTAKTKVRLAEEVLEEIPDQIVGYMKSENIVPANIKNVKDTLY